MEYTDFTSEKEGTANMELRIAEQNEKAEQAVINRNLTQINDPDALLMPSYATYDAVTNLDVLEDKVTKRINIQGVNVDEEQTAEDVELDRQRAIQRETQQNQEIGIESLRNVDAMVDRTTDDYYDSKAFIKTKVKTRSHRWGKTKRDRMKTSVKKLRGVNDKIALFKRKQSNPNIMLTRDEKLAAYEDIYSEIHSADRYYAEGVATSELEERCVKMKADYSYMQNMIVLYQREKEFAGDKKTEALNRIKEIKSGEYTERQAEAERKNVEYWTAREHSFKEKEDILTPKAVHLRDEIERLSERLQGN